MSESVLCADRVSRAFGELTAVDRLSVSIPNNRVVALLGPNGAGKTTFLRLLMGLLEPSEGTVGVLGHSSRRMPGDVSARIGWVGEGHEPPGWATLQNMIALQAGASPKFDRTVAEELLAERELEPKRRYAVLSKGQKRWALGTLALASGADVLIMDEPADGLDPSARRSLYAHVRDYVNRHEATVLIATHIIADIERVADDVLIIDRGRLLLQASLEDLRDQVREIEAPQRCEIPDLGPDVQLLREEERNGSRRLWVRCRDDADEALRGRFEQSVTLRPVNLESLYLVLTEQGDAACL